MQILGFTKLGPPNLPRRRKRKRKRTRRDVSNAQFMNGSFSTTATKLGKILDQLPRIQDYNLPNPRHAVRRRDPSSPDGRQAMRLFLSYPAGDVSLFIISFVKGK